MNEIQKALNEIMESSRTSSSLGELACREVVITGEEMLDIANVLNRLNQFLKSAVPGQRGKSIDEVMDSELKAELTTLVMVTVPNLINKLKMQ